jgi:putative ABC transport system ATP-binding protein
MEDSARVPILRVHGLHRSFSMGSERLHVLKGVDLSINGGQLVMLRGRSGSGKTTLLNLIGGLDMADDGEVELLGHNLIELTDDERAALRRENVGFIFQSYALMPMLSAAENVELSLRMAGIPRKLWKSRVNQCLAQVGLEKRAKHRPFELSGGEQQRVAIAKALAHQPKLLLADEPTAELDSKTAADMVKLFYDLTRAEQLAVCMTTHDPTLLEVADYVYEMVDGQFAASAHVR